MKKLSKIKMASECLQAMSFLGIPASNFRSYRIQFGSLVALHSALSQMLQEPGVWSSSYDRNGKSQKVFISSL